MTCERESHGFPCSSRPSSHHQAHPFSLSTAIRRPCRPPCTAGPVCSPVSLLLSFSPTPSAWFPSRSWPFLYALRCCKTSLHLPGLRVFPTLLCFMFSPWIMIMIRVVVLVLCCLCRYIYNERTPFEKLPDNYFCPGIVSIAEFFVYLLLCGC